MNFPKIIIFDSPDRSGKDTQIQLLQAYFWMKHKEVFQVIKYSNNKYISSDECLEYSKKLYDELLRNFHNLKVSTIFNRSHIGESIYSPLYRNYNGDYVFELEKQNYINMLNNVYLIHLYNHECDLLSREDGLSFTKDLDQKRIEIDKFYVSFHKSIIKYKLCVNCYKKSKEQINGEIIQFLEGGENVTAN